MENGIFDRDTGVSIELKSRDDLRENEEIQKILRQNHHASRLSCLCCRREGRFLTLVPMLPPGSKELVLARDDVEAHPSWCFLNKTNDDTESERRRASSIFRPVRPPPIGYSNERPGTSLGCRAHYETFASYARAAFSLGVADAYILKNRGRVRHVNPTPLEVLSAIDGAIRQLAFTDAPDGYAAATKGGVSLRFGLVFDLVETDGIPDGRFNCYWWTGGSFSVGLVGVPPEAMVPAVGALKLIRGMRAPPYFVLAVQDPNRRCHRVFFHPVAVAPDSLFPVDSGPEAVFGQGVIRLGAALIKPVLKDDVDRVLAAFGFELSDKTVLKYRPDFLMFWPMASQQSLQIRELRGFEKGTLPTYDQLMAIKEAYYLALTGSLPLRYKEMDGTKLVWNSPTDGTEPWLNTGLPEEPADGLFG